ncbi:Vms1/Ankzf1 family peptidyl-tRNA hydrolase [Actinomadura sp. WMMA1423]|uniref:baeRF2 domain-containing protein n=1 Tax=Actinomadura sp. WMMA1423 TaxID=2591108 RepID=UPI0011469D69|nr:Vms1/Ankzf1 family peptidyl-tRNA hydrolase [Actinomadura sp. WMMA1423]
MKSDERTTTETLRRLCSGGPVTSVYFNLTAPPGEEDAALRRELLAKRLRAQGADEAAVEAVDRLIMRAEPGSGAVAVFAVEDIGAVDGEPEPLVVEMPGARPRDLAVHGPVPCLLPLLAWLQERPPYVLTLVDRKGADIETCRGGTTAATTRTVDGPDDEIVRNAPGGWSQSRHQHRAEDSWEHNATRVAHALAGDLADSGARVLLLGGDVRAMQYLTKHLPEGVRQEVTVGHVSGGRGRDGAWQRRKRQVREQVGRWADEETRGLLKRLDEGRGPSGLAVEGAVPTLRALARGQVATLLVADDPADRRTAWFGPAPTQVSDRRTPLVEEGASPVVRGRLADVAVRAAVLTGAEVHVLDPEAPGLPSQGIGALCRYA